MRLKELFLEGAKLNWEFIDSIEQFNRLKDVPQSQKWHREGNVYTHTKLVVGEMINQMDIFGIDFDSDYYRLMIGAALCHDLGKYGTTYFNEEVSDYKCKNHAIESEKITRELFQDEESDILEMLCSMVRWHMDLHHVLDSDNPENKIKKLIAKCGAPIDDMVILNYCDSKGSINDESEGDIINKINTINQYILNIKDDK